MLETKSFLGRAFTVTSIFLLTSCASTNYSKVTPIPTAMAPVAPVAQRLESYKVQIGDVLDINLYLNPELNETVTVRPDGMISTKIAEDVYVYNKTPSQITAMLKRDYRHILKDPAITTVVRSFAPIKIYVSGEVFQPGEFLVVGQPLTLTQAIARAGGVKNSAEEDKVLILRRGAGEESQVFVADYYGATQGADPRKDARLANEDVVFVPKTGTALGYAKYQQGFQQFITPAVGVGAAYNVR